jgi:hypothetical protein
MTKIPLNWATLRRKLSWTAQKKQCQVLSKRGEKRLKKHSWNEQGATNFEQICQNCRKLVLRSEKPKPKLPKNLVSSLLRILSKRGYLNDENIYAVSVLTLF